MSSEMWAMQMLRKYRLAVDFEIEYVEDIAYNRFYWGVDEDYATFEQALQAMVETKQ